MASQNVFVRNKQTAQGQANGQKKWRRLGPKDNCLTTGPVKTPLRCARAKQQYRVVSRTPALPPLPSILGRGHRLTLVDRGGPGPAFKPQERLGFRRAHLESLDLPPFPLINCQIITLATYTPIVPIVQATCRPGTLPAIPRGRGTLLHVGCGDPYIPIGTTVPLAAAHAARPSREHTTEASATLRGSKVPPLTACPRGVQQLGVPRGIGPRVHPRCHGRAVGVGADCQAADRCGEVGGAFRSPLYARFAVATHSGVGVG